MTHSSLLRAFALLAAFSSAASSAEKLSREHVEFFEKKIRPILVQHCYECHSHDSKKIEGELLLDSKQGWEHGGASGPVIMPGNPDESPLIAAVKHKDLEMPPKGKISDSEIADLVQWVRMGAPDPRDGDVAGLVKREIDIEEGRKYWAFQPPQRREPPSVKKGAWSTGDIDRFVLAKLEEKQIEPVADADPEVLVRRLYFDLIGLPPSPEELDKWTDRLTAPQREARNADALAVGSRLNEAALEVLVDELLASPHFGERWGRHWLDVARFAESTGMERNVTFPAAWRYRDYVIQSFNNDKPYNQFVQEQLAGDLLPGTSKENRDERIIATGFLAMGPKSLNERDRNIFVMDVVDEQIDVATRAVMGVTVSCARCHDHKFDPFPQTDYYAMAGIFRSCETYFGATGGQGNRQPSSLIALSQSGDESSDSDGQSTNDQPNKKRLAELKSQLEEAKKELADLGNADKQKAKAARRKVQQLTQQIAAVSGGGGNKKNGGGGKLPPGPAAMGLVDDDIADCRLHIRGNTETLGESVPRGFLQVVALENQPAIGDEQSGRLELAQWMTAADNPLTARVMANRAWHWLFGQGIVRTVDNFGAMGERPSNVELLDHLALRLIDDGWSVKKLVRAIVLSRTYQLASDHHEQNFAKDPENLLCWRQNHRRLEAESLRDAVLAASGKLDRTPVESSPVAKMVGVNVGRETDALSQIDRGNFRHRSVYMPILRNALPEVLAVFDFAEPSIIVGRRQITTVPSQALFMMNSDFIVDQSLSLADRLLAEKDMDASERIQHAYRLVLCRTATADELAKTTEFVDQFETSAADVKNAHRDALAAVCQALFAAAEFRYVE